MFKKLRTSIIKLIADSKNEYQETKQMTKLLWKAKTNKLSHDEIDEVKDQSLDLLRLTFLSALFIIPFSGVLIIILVKGGQKVGIRLLPSSFENKKA